MRTIVSYSCSVVGCKHEMCDGVMTVSHPVSIPIAPYTVPRFKDGIRRHKDVMFAEWTKHVVANYALDDHQIVELVARNEYAETSLLFKSVMSTVQRCVRPPFPIRSDVRTVARVNIDEFAPQILALDQFYFEMVCPSFDIRPYHYRSPNDDLSQLVEHRVKSGLPVPTLVELCARRLSLYNYAYGRNGGLPYWCSTNESMQALDYQNMYAAFDVNTVDRGAGYERAMHLFASALNIAYDMLGTRRYFHTLHFHYNPARIMREINANSSPGIVPTNGDRAVTLGGARMVATTSKIKMIHLGRAVQDHQAWVRSVLRHEESHFTNYNVIKMKVERRFAYAKSVEDCRAIQHKKREFFIPSLRTIIHNTWVSKDRMMLERGNVINIGRVWWHGGALQYAQCLNYDVPHMTWNEGDYYMHDKHVQDYLLHAYMATTGMYYDMDVMTDDERYLFFCAHDEAIFNMIVKPVAHLAPDTWSVVRGVLYSGGPETSSCGSWCTLLMFCCFVVHIMELYPALAPAIRRSLAVRLIFITVYGDDHLYSCPDIFPMLDEYAFAKFSHEVFGCVIRDIRVHKSFLSVPNLATGGFVFEGPKFLKRYFIQSDNVKLAKVLPYKPIAETISRLIAPKTSRRCDAVLACIGQAWDTMFTNLPAYNLCLRYYELHIEADHGYSRLMLEKYIKEDRAYAADYANKLNLSLEFFFSFPEYYTRQVEFHVVEIGRAHV